MSIANTSYYPDVVNGNVFIGATAAAGVAIPISTGTAVTFGLWNNTQNTNAAILDLSFGVTSGTIALGQLGLANQFVGYNVASGAAMTAFTAGTPKNAMTGLGKASVMQFCPSTATLAAGGTALWWSGSSIESATPGLGIFNAYIPIEGRIVVAPGQIVFACASVAQTALFSISMTWVEIPR